MTFFLHFSLLDCPKPTLAGHWYDNDGVGYGDGDGDDDNHGDIFR